MIIEVINPPEFQLALQRGVGVLAWRYGERWGLRSISNASFAAFFASEADLLAVCPAAKVIPPPVWWEETGEVAE